jgi:hypothetical protein
MTITLFKEATVAVEWTIVIEGKNEFGDTCLHPFMSNDSGALGFASCTKRQSGC